MGFGAKGITLHGRFWITAAIIVSVGFAGCATRTPQEVPQEKIRNRANQAFKDLSTAERGSADTSLSETMNSDGVNTAHRTGVEIKVAVKTGRRPDWVDGPSSRYPYNRYITGVGYGPDRQSAEDKARAEIAKIFYSDIRSSNRTYQSILENNTNGKSTSAENINFTEITRVSTRVIFSGSKIAQVYRDRSAQPEFFALAVLDRNLSRVMLKSKISELDENIQRHLSAAGQQRDKLSQVRLLQAGIRDHALRQAYNTELRIVDPVAKGIPPPINITDIKTRLDNILLKDFFIGLSVDGPGADEVGQAIVEALNQRGFAVCEEIDKASILARGMIEINALPRNATGWIFVRWRAFFDLIDRDGGAVFSSVQKSGKTGHLTLNHAENRAVGYMRKVLAAEISENLSKYIRTRKM